MEDKRLEIEEVVEAAEAVAEVPAVEETPVAEAVEAVPEVIESMDDYAAELEASMKRVAVGDVLTGTIIGVTEDTVMVDLKYYSQGVIARADYTNDTEHSLAELAIVGDTVTATVVRRDDGEGNIVLSCKEAMDKMAWDKMEAALEEGTAMTVKISGVVKAGVIAWLRVSVHLSPHPSWMWPMWKIQRSGWAARWRFAPSPLTVRRRSWCCLQRNWPESV